MAECAPQLDGGLGGQDVHGGHDRHAEAGEDEEQDDGEGVGEHHEHEQSGPAGFVPGQRGAEQRQRGDEAEAGYGPT